LGLSYKGGVSMDQEASWVGLGWNINPGTITRNMRGLPDDFDGRYDSVKKTMSIKENKTVGITAGYDQEIVGMPSEAKGKKDTTFGPTVGGSFGVFYNNYKGWGFETALNASINSGRDSKGPLTGGLSVTDNTQEGLSISPSLSARFLIKEKDENAFGNVSLSLPYNTRSGMKGLQMSTGIRQSYSDKQNQKHSIGLAVPSEISFASPAFTPTMTMPLTNTQFSFTAKVGFEKKVTHPSATLSGYVSRQKIADADTLQVFPSFGYLHFQEGAKNASSLTDFNLEKEIPYREKPAIPNIAVPSYTYDAFSITGEGTGGMFRAYRGDIGYVHDHFIRSKDASDRASIDVGVGDIVHIGVDLNMNRAFTQSGPWTDKNVMGNIIGFRNNNLAYEAAYFRNPGEKTTNAKSFYDAVGGDDVVAVQLNQSSRNSSAIMATAMLARYRNKRQVGSIALTPQTAVKTERDKRTQVISYLTAKEADAGGLSKFIDSYTLNLFDISQCNELNTNPITHNGIRGRYYRTNNLTGTYVERVDGTPSFVWGNDPPHDPDLLVSPPYPSDNYSVRWEGRIKAPNTGPYTFAVKMDDGIRLWLNDSLILNDWSIHH
ncbi:MAG: hypothetical protein JST39_03780, partial [Bacteroidetes bacterium]|nr:hypothetical protein [Bacteroidota bacterium]